MDNQHKKIKGYRDLSQQEIDLMNEIKAKGEELRALVAKIAEVAVPKLEADPAPVGEREQDALTEGKPWSVETEGDDPLFWLRYADSSFRCGVMYAVRAVAKPTSY
ncbi:Acb2/Tad1 domain-containing protein [Paraburkholderia bannensis]|uniref:Acb2/Tad1 domain-containing protein n=1 Tax=Paraburkholderia bannensis TaxID=765414 RepID=UPI002AB61B89|nr:hypothetical protein [Paraburkholderia bannensis]